MEIGSMIRTARENNNYTQEQVAEKLMVSRQTISNWENSKTLPDITSVVMMSDLYEISLDELLKGDLKMLEKIEKDEKELQRLKKDRRNIIEFMILSIMMVLAANIEPHFGIRLDISNHNIHSLIDIISVISICFLLVLKYYDDTSNEGKKHKLYERLIAAVIICFMINASIIAVKTIMLYGAISLEGITGIIMAGQYFYVP